MARRAFTPLANPYGRLGELAGFKGQPDAWCKQTREHLEFLYDGDPDSIILNTRGLATAVGNGMHQAQERLDEARQHYASYWLLRQIECTPLPSIEVQGQHWHSSTVALPDRQLMLTLAVAGFDTVTPKMNDGSPILHGFMVGASAEQVAEFIGYVPPEYRALLINHVDANNMTAVHAAATAAGAGSLTVLHEVGGDLTTLVPIRIVGDERVMGNAAHIAVIQGRCDVAAELMALDRSLFVRTSPEVKYSPSEMVEVCASRMPQVDSDIRKAANIAAFAVDRPLPFAEVGWVLRNLLPATAPRALISHNSLN